jgi:DNA-directed RNA polymerase specialized sigma24 family protein
MERADPTALLTEWRNGNRAALDKLFPLVYNDLRRRARAYLRGQTKGHTLDTTALVHETYLKLVAVDRIKWEDRAHFLALKRGGGRVPVSLEEAVVLTDTGADQMLSLDGALQKLAMLNERLSRTVELRFFGGLTVEETAEVLGVAPSTVKLDWQKAKAWLYRELSEE